MQVEKDAKQILTFIKVSKVNAPQASFNLGKCLIVLWALLEITFLSDCRIATIIAGVIGIGNILLISKKRHQGTRRSSRLGATPVGSSMQIILEPALTIVAGIFGIVLGAFVLAGINAGTANKFPLYQSNRSHFICPWGIINHGHFDINRANIAQRAVSIKPIDALRENKIKINKNPCYEQNSPLFTIASLLGAICLILLSLTVRPALPMNPNGTHYLN